MRVLFLLLLLCASAKAGQQTLFWDVSGSPGVNRYEFRFGTNSGAYQTTNVVMGGTKSNATFTLPAGRWFAVAYALNVSNGVSEASNEVQFEIPQPVVIRLNLSSADNPEGPWMPELGVMPIYLTATEARRYFRLEIDQ